MTILEQYENGNCLVTIHTDGTKTREWDGEPTPLMPESVDLKITDWCDAGCAWCHESSTVKGKHATLRDIMAILADAQAGMEIAVGGGDPLSHPDIEDILSWMRQQRLIPNLTINGRHVAKHMGLIYRLRKHGLFFGLGISEASNFPPDNGDQAAWDQWLAHEKAMPAVVDSNTVLHMIAGVHHIPYQPGTLGLGSHYGPEKCHYELKKLLILGYKQHGRGVKHDAEAVALNIAEWRYWLPSLMRLNLTISFDNLALQQLNVKALVPDDVWQKHYMGDDGTFTMYVDAVTNSFAPTSTSKRKLREGMNLQEMFASVRSQK